ncbi:MAG: hypothetical protein KW793_03205 [Candidatus Doudnabacteria bacterium]|nr:hypothetical protein [Candidatus Doudnabacteria bacterium]
MSIDDLKKDIQENSRGSGERAETFKLKNGNNRMVILTNPQGFSEVYGIGIAYEDSGYGKYAARRYKCYIYDLADKRVKIANFSYTVSKKLLDLAEGARTHFTDFPMPYVINMKTEKAGTKEVETSVLAEEDFEMTPDVKEELENYDSITEILDRLKSFQRKKVEESPELQDKIEAFLDKKAEEEREREEKRRYDKEKAKNPEVIAVIEYPEEEINPEDVPF